MIQPIILLTDSIHQALPKSLYDSGEITQQRMPRRSRGRSKPTKDTWRDRENWFNPKPNANNVMFLMWAAISHSEPAGNVGSVPWRFSDNLLCSSWRCPYPVSCCFCLKLMIRPYFTIFSAWDCIVIPTWNGRHGLLNKTNIEVKSWLPCQESYSRNWMFFIFTSLWIFHELERKAEKSK